MSSLYSEASCTAAIASKVSCAFSKSPSVASCTFEFILDTVDEIFSIFSLLIEIPVLSTTSSTKSLIKLSSDKSTPDLPLKASAKAEKAESDALSSTSPSVAPSTIAEDKFIKFAICTAAA